MANNGNVVVKEAYKETENKAETIFTGKTYKLVNNLPTLEYIFGSQTSNLRILYKKEGKSDDMYDMLFAIEQSGSTYGDNTGVKWLPGIVLALRMEESRFDMCGSAQRFRKITIANQKEVEKFDKKGFGYAADKDSIFVNRDEDVSDRWAKPNEKPIVVLANALKELKDNLLTEWLYRMHTRKEQDKIISDLEIVHNVESFVNRAIEMEEEEERKAMREELKSKRPNEDIDAPFSC